MYHFVIYLSIQAFIIYSYVYVYVLLSICLSHFLIPLLSLHYLYVHLPTQTFRHPGAHLSNNYPPIYSLSQPSPSSTSTQHPFVYLCIDRLLFYIFPCMSFLLFFSLPFSPFSIPLHLSTPPYDLCAHAYNCICLTLYLSGWGGCICLSTGLLSAYF